MPTTLKFKCSICNNDHQFTSNEALLGFICMIKFDYLSPDLMCEVCGLDHTGWIYIGVEWDNEPNETQW